MLDKVLLASVPCTPLAHSEAPPLHDGVWTRMPEEATGKQKSLLPTTTTTPWGVVTARTRECSKASASIGFRRRKEI
uniref:Putative secreted protein n=1 Tax=Anopheles marajoara TaxID=58244 RepID=A0A2M4CDM7_9DIPT